MRDFSVVKNQLVALIWNIVAWCWTWLPARLQRKPNGSIVGPKCVVIAGIPRAETISRARALARCFD